MFSLDSSACEAFLIHIYIFPNTTNVEEVLQIYVSVINFLHKHDDDDTCQTDIYVVPGLNYLEYCTFIKINK